jgi:peroxiredoxin
VKNLKWILLMLLCLTWVGCSSVVDDDTQVVERVHVGDRVPSFSVTMTDGGEERTFSTSQLTGETVIVFFNTWCPDCQRELPRLNQYYLQHKDDKGFQMVAISRGEGKDVVARFWSEHELVIPYAAQEDTSIYELFASGIIPRVYFVSAQGIVTRIDVEQFAI